MAIMLPPSAQPPAAPKEGPACPIMSKLVSIPVPSQGLQAPGQMGMELQNVMVRVPCSKADCQCWDAERNDCGLKETRKCLA